MKLAKVDHCEKCPLFEDGVGRCSASGGMMIGDIYVLGSAAGQYMEGGNFDAFSGEAGRMYISLIKDVKKRDPNYMKVRLKYHHATHCFPSDGSKVNAEMIKGCSGLVKNDIYNSKAKVILALGADAMRALDIQGTVAEMRGQSLTTRIGNRDIPVIVSFNPGALLRKENAGKLPTCKSDIAMALQVAAFGMRKRKSIEELTSGYTMVKSPAEFKELVDYVLAHPSDRPDGTEGPAEENLLAIDTETAVEGGKYSAINTWVPGFKCIALSVAWGAGKSAAVLLDHRENPFKYEEYVHDLRRLLESPNPKTFHNVKYELKTLEMALGLYIHNVVFDSMMGEYLLDENKAGEYGLKKVTKNRAPDFYGYEKMLKDETTVAQETIQRCKERITFLVTRSREQSGTLKLAQTEVNLAKGNKKGKKEKDDPEEFARLSNAVHDAVAERDRLKVVKAATTEEHRVVKERKKAAENVIDSEKDQSFEDIPVDNMLLYAAIDTDITRTASKQQIREIKLDDPKLFNVLAKVMLPGVRVLAEMEHIGIKVNQEYLDELIVFFEGVIVENANAIYLKVGREFNLNSSKELINVLVTDFGVKLTKKTKTGGVSTDASVMEDLAKEHDIARMILDYKKAYKARHTFLEGIKNGGKSRHDYGCSVDGRIHGNYNQTVAATGRLCIAKGSMVDIVRDVSMDPEGIPIELVKKGDLAYTYDKANRLTIRPVVWSGKTGHKRTLRVHWKGTGNTKSGFVDATPEHKFYTIDGTTKEAKDLVSGDRLLSLGRSNTSGYARLHPFGNTELREHRLVNEYITGTKWEHVHHRNENKMDNVPPNLVGMTAAEHTAMHSTARMKSASRRAGLSATLKKLRKDEPERWAHSHKTGEAHACFVRVSALKLLKLLAKHKGCPTKCCTFAGVKDYNTFMQKLESAGIDWKKVALRYSNSAGRGAGGSGEYLSRNRVVEALLRSSKVSRVTRDLRIGTKKLRGLLEYYGLRMDLNNHVVTAVEHTGRVEDVYCLEVEETHNFICNEVCVANSSSQPNMQNVPLKILDMNIKKLFDVDDPETEVMVQADYSAAEVRVLTAYAPDPELIKVLNSGRDMHSYVGSKVFAKMGLRGTKGVSYDDLKEREQFIETNPIEFARLDEMRQVSKMVMFLTIYGGTSYTLHGNLEKAGIQIPQTECEKIMDSLLKEFPAIKKYMRIIKNTVNVKGEVQTFFGRKRRFPIARHNFKMKNAAHREAINAPIQGTSSDIVVHQMCELHGVFKEMGYINVLRGTVHDSIFFKWPKNDLHKLEKILDVHLRDNVNKHFPWMPVVFHYDVEFGPNYGEAKTNLKKAKFDEDGKLLPPKEKKA